MMDKIMIKVDNIDDILLFNKTMSQFNGEAKLVKGKYRCDAKSLMGLLAIDTSEPTIVEFDLNDRAELLNLVKPFIYTEK